MLICSLYLRGLVLDPFLCTVSPQERTLIKKVLPIEIYKGLLNWGMKTPNMMKNTILRSGERIDPGGDEMDLLGWVSVLLPSLPGNPLGSGTFGMRGLISHVDWSQLWAREAGMPSQRC